jgi:hypothetical protein
MKRIVLFILTQIICIAIEIGTLFIARFSLYIWILLVIAASVIIYLAYKNQISKNLFAIKIVVTEIVALALWVYGAWLFLDAYGMYGSSMEDGIARGITLFIFAPIQSLWSTGCWAFLKLWPFNDINFVRYMSRHS